MSIACPPRRADRPESMDELADHYLASHNGSSFHFASYQITVGSIGSDRIPGAGVLFHLLLEMPGDEDQLGDIESLEPVHHPVHHGPPGVRPGRRLSTAGQGGTPLCKTGCRDVRERSARRASDVPRGHQSHRCLAECAGKRQEETPALLLSDAGTEPACLRRSPAAGPPG